MLRKSSKEKSADDNNVQRSQTQAATSMNRMKSSNNRATSNRGYLMNCLKLRKRKQRCQETSKEVFF
jgi:hypothetical protein